ncbi:homeobox protein 2-like [Mytilus trossulus]|uniref:homeobox protein 2-like n=1 Tax=Mytilus trossulus TaxID=6551 RepID=UPI003006969D
MTVFTIFVGILVSGCYCFSLPGLQNVQTDDNFTKTFGIIPGKNIYKKTDPNHSIDTEQLGEHVLSSQEKVPTSVSNHGSLATTLNQLSGMSALQLLKILGVQLGSNAPLNINTNAIIHRQPQNNVQKQQYYTGEPLKPTMKTLSNYGQKTGSFMPMLDKQIKGYVSTETDNNILSKPQQMSNAGKSNTQQQVSPVFMMTSGMGGISFPDTSSIQQPSGSTHEDNKAKLFDPDALMQEMMSSSSSSLGAGKYMVKQNVSPQNWAPNQQNHMQTNTKNSPGTFNSMHGQTSINFNPDSFNNVKMNFQPDALLLFVNKETPHISNKLTYNPDILNNYHGKFKPGQMFQVEDMNTPLPPVHQSLFNADTLNKKLMSSVKNSEDPNPNSENTATSLESKIVPQPSLKKMSGFVPGLLFPGFKPDNDERGNHFSEYDTNFVERAEDIKKSTKPRYAFVDMLSDLPADPDYSVNQGNQTNQTAVAPTGQSETTITGSMDTTTQGTTIVPTTSTDMHENHSEPGKFMPAQSNSPQNGFVPGSLTGDGRTLQMMVNKGMYNPNVVNQQAFVMNNNQNTGSSNVNNNTTHQTSNSFGMTFNFNPSSVNQAKMSFNTNQQIGMDGSSGSTSNNYNTFYDPNKVNQNSYINPFDKAQTNMNNMSTGQYDNSQFLGNFDANQVNRGIMGNSRNSTQNSMHSGFGGQFNPTEVNKAYFNPNVVNKERMNFNPSKMLESNAGYDKKTAESYTFDPNKVNDIHVNFIPPFLQDNKNSSTGNSSGSGFIPGLLSGGKDNSGVFDPSKMEAGMLFNPNAMMNTNKNTTENRGNSDKSQTNMMFNPSAMIGNMKGLISGASFDPNAVNKINMNFSPNEMMKQVAGSDEGTTRTNNSVIGYGNDEKVK